MSRDLVEEGPLRRLHGVVHATWTDVSSSKLINKNLFMLQCVSSWHRLREAELAPKSFITCLACIGERLRFEV